MMLLPALLQTSLLLSLVQQTLQGGVKPQSVAYGRMQPGAGIGIKPGVAGALGALGGRYGAKAMKTGIGRYPAAHLGGYKSLGLGGKAGVKQGGYMPPGAYGASLGAGMGLGPGFPNGLGLGMGQGKRAYGGGLGTLPGYGPYGGVGYPGARQGASAADLGGPEAAGLGQAGQHLMRERNRGLGNSYGKEDVTRGFEGVPDLHGPDHEPSLLRPRAPLDQQNRHLGLGPSHARPEDQTKGTADHGAGAALAAADVRRPLPADRDHIRGPASPRDFDPSMQQKPTGNCGSPPGLLELLKSKRPEVSGPEPQGAQSLNPSAQRERTDHLPLLQGQDVRKYKSLPPQGQPTTGDLSVLAVRQDPNGPADKTPDRFKLRGMAESGRPGFGPVIPAETGEERQIQVFPPEDAKRLSEAGPIKTSSKAVHVPGQTGRRTQAPSFLGGGGNFLGGGLGAGGYGAGAGQGAYLGGAAGKLGAAAALGQGGYPHGVGGKSNGYGDGAAGYLGAAPGNGFGYGNGYGDAYGAELGYPAELADGAENKAGKSKALGAGAFAGQAQGGYGALGAGLDPAAAKYGGGPAPGPFGNGAVIPAGLEGDGGYALASQPLSLVAEGTKTASKYGYGAQLGAAHDGLGEQMGKYGYKG